ncbi:hypothetical protein HAX54_011822 [Datura stramonium]|uniref:Uncharacterized protein n=1 Tax=Datura stramonium TaxID=4076 RepID=A0ABS8TKP8_DATST|nr:hypothetical protein [Datura stramonium]
MEGRKIHVDSPTGFRRSSPEKSRERKRGEGAAVGEGEKMGKGKNGEVGVGGEEEGREGWSGDEGEESAAACCFPALVMGDGEKRVEREVTGWVCCRKLWRYGCGVLVGGGEGERRVSPAAARLDGEGRGEGDREEVREEQGRQRCSCRRRQWRGKEEVRRLEV